MPSGREVLKKRTHTVVWNFEVLKGIAVSQLATVVLEINLHKRGLAS